MYPVQTWPVFLFWLVFLRTCRRSCFQRSSVVEMAQKDPTASLNEQVSFGYEQMEKAILRGLCRHFSRRCKRTRLICPLCRDAMIHAERMDYPEFSAYDSIVRLVSQHSLAWNRRGLAAFNMEDFDLALTSFERATESRPVNGFLYESIAWTRMCRGEYESCSAVG